MRHQTIRGIQRIIGIIGFVAVLGIFLVISRVAGYPVPVIGGEGRQGFLPAVFNQPVALISGHAGSDSGAVCTDADGRVVLTEAEITARITQLVAERLRNAGADVLILNEYDERLEGLRARVLVSLHADSCIAASGYKAAHRMNSPMPEIEDRLLACIQEHYPAVTGLPHHPNTITHNMTEYHAYRRLDASTPAAILEMGFLGGDQALLTQQPDLVARGIADSVLCFLDGPATAQE